MRSLSSLRIKEHNLIVNHLYLCLSAKVHKSAWMAEEFIGTPAQYPRIIASNFKKILNFANYFFVLKINFLSSREKVDIFVYLLSQNAINVTKVIGPQ